jgi:hypothetical protein
MMQSPAIVKPILVLLELLCVDEWSLRASGGSDLFGRLLVG